jgi:hypothetical protein
MLDLFDDANLYQTWSYGAVRWGRKNLSHLVLRRCGEAVGMAQLRIVRPVIGRFGMAYLRWGPLCERRGEPLDSEVFRAMAVALEEEYVRRRRLMLRILPNAFAGSRRAGLFASEFAGFKREPLTSTNAYRTFVIDLSPTLDDLRRNLDKKWRNRLNQSDKKNLKVVVGNGPDEYRTFRRLYCEMKKRKNFESTVDVDEFANIQNDLPESQRMRILICEDGTGPVAALVASAIGDSAVYVLGATGNDALNTRGAYLLQWTLIKWLKENGFKWYDLGGIDPESNPGVYHFKKGLSGKDVCQINPLVACDNFVSSGIVRVGFALQRAARGCRTVLRFPRDLRPQSSGN